jgi:adenylate cyclase class 2
LLIILINPINIEGINMVTEIELKAHVEDAEGLRLLLLKKAGYLGKFEKEDHYWFPDEVSPNNVSGFLQNGLRVRREECCHPDGNVEAVILATYKTKEVSSGIEINDEREFEISRGRPDFEEFLMRIGFKPRAMKRKRGWAFSREGIRAELCEVEDLGWFLELEILADNREAITIEKERKHLLDFLSELGIDQNAIESRYYSQMLSKKP